MERGARRHALRLLTVGISVVLVGATWAQAGFVWTWGGNDSGQLGNGTVVGRTIPGRIPNLGQVAAIAAGGSHSLGLQEDGSVWAWGANANGQMGNGTVGEDVYSPVPTQGIVNARAIAAGGAHSLCLLSDGTAWGWGDNEVGQLGDGTNTSRSLPVRATGVHPVAAFAGGIVHTLALRFDGSAMAYGRNLYGQLGDGTTADRWTPVPVIGLGDALTAAASHHNLALLADGTVWAWGRNLYGQLGDGSTTDRWVPVPVPGLSGVVAVACGEWHSLALRWDGTVWAWGRNAHGQLGVGTREDRPTPGPVGFLQRAVGIAAGYDHSLAILADGRLLAWGANAFGQLGDGTTADREEPIEVPLAVPIRSASGGRFHTLALEGEPVRVISGLVALQDLVVAPARFHVVCEVRTPGTNQIVETQTVSLGAGGHLLLSTSRSGTYDLAFKADHWLRAKVADVAIGDEGVFGLSVSLLNGDVNNDNSINIADFLQLRAAFGTRLGDGQWNPNADLDESGTVAIADFLILRQNFGYRGS